jgi:hypothetical protein
MNKDSIRTNVIKESLDDFLSVYDTLKENTADAVKNLLGDTVRETYDKILRESEEEDENNYDKDEVDDTIVDTDTNDDETEDNSSDEESEESTTETNVSDDGNEVSVSSSGEDKEGNEWSEFEKYKVGDDSYDLLNADDNDVVRVFKLMGDEDQVCVKKDDNRIDIKDNETGAEYILDLDTLDDNSDVIEDDIDAEGDLEENNENMTNESTIYEVMLDEYDSHVGYTDNYQSKDVLTTDGMEEPGKNVRDIDGGVPKGKEKPWSGRKPSKDDKPFTSGKGKTVEEEKLYEISLDEQTNVGGAVQMRATGGKTHSTYLYGKKMRPYNQHHRSIAGEYETEDEATNGETKNESIMRMANRIYKENKQLKNVLSHFRNTLKEAAVTNVNLGQIIKLISENATTKDEKMEIIERFSNDANTIEESKKLYNVISRELKKNVKSPMTESKEISANSSRIINETKIYKSPDLENALGLMHKICK